MPGDSVVGAVIGELIGQLLDAARLSGPHALAALPSQQPPRPLAAIVANGPQVCLVALTMGWTGQGG